MRIAINTRFLLQSKMEGFGWFTYETVKRIVEKHPDDEFIFFFDRPFDEKFIFAKNVKGVVLSPQARHPILFKIWFNYSISRALKKHKADIFFSPDGYLSLRTKCPQIGVIHDLNFEHHPEDLPKIALNYLKTYFPKFAKKAEHIITVSNYSKQDICRTYQIPAKKITVAHNGASELFTPIHEDEKIKIRGTYSDNADFFVFVGALHARKNIERLFKAFDQFKIKSKSKTKLLIVGEKLWKDINIEKSFNNLKYKSDIIFTGHLPLKDLTKVVAAAKALTFPSYFEGFGIPIIEAMRANCPVICGNLTSLPEVAGGAALLIDPYSHDSISDALNKIDSDSQLRQELIFRGSERAKDFSWDKTASIIWSVLNDYRKK